MTDWKVGDEIVAVKKNQCSCASEVFENVKGIPKEVKSGVVYRITGFSSVSCPSGSGVIVSGVRNHDNYGNIVGHCRGSFRKVQHDKREACESEFVTLLKRSKRRVGA